MSGPPARAWRGPRPADVTAISLLALAVIALTFEGFVGQLPSVRDMASATLPSRWFFRESLLSGHLALWNPYVSLGYATVADPVHGTFYPFQLPVALLPFPAGFFATWALHALLAGAGGYVLARSCGCRPESALVAGLAWAIGGYTTSMWWNCEKLLVTAWIPWVAWGVRETARAPRVFGKELVIAAVSGAMVCVAGDPFLLFDAALLGVAAALVAVPGEGDSPGASPPRVLLASGAGLALAVLLAAPALLPAALLSPDTDRGGALALAQAQAWSMSPVRWLDLFVPSPLGDALGTAQTYAGAPYADSVSQVHPWAVSMFAGGATFALATAARGRRVVGPLWGVAAIAVLLALGRHAPFEAWARAIVPGLARSRFPEKHAVVACGAIALLASRGAEEVLSRRVSAARVLGVAAVGLAFVIVLAPGPLHATTRRGAVHAAIAVGALACALFALRRTARAAWLVPLFLAADLVTSSRALLAWMPASALVAPPVARALGSPPGQPPRRLLRLPSADFRRVATLPFNAASLFGIDMVSGWDPAMSPLVELLPTALGGGKDRQDRLLELLRVDAVIVPSDPESMTPDWSERRIPPRPRVWMVGAVVPAKTDGEALRLLGAPELDPERVAVVPENETSAEVGALANAAPRELGGCEVVDYRPARIAIRCRAAAPALVVVPDAAMPGWKATVDGAAAELVRTDVALRGIVLGAGEHRVEMTFEPPGLVEGLLGGAIGSLVAALALARGKRADQTSG